jgi:hypothetical protein
MTPAQHATAAAQELAAAATPDGLPHARLAQVHAALSKRAGTGTEYTNAEQLITAASGAAANVVPLLDQALAWALLAA